MNIVVCNGSPKGSNSITLQTVNYLARLFPEHNFNIFHVGQRIRSYEKDPQPVFAALAEADLILFSYPVYTFLAPAQLHQFLRILKESGPDLTGKYVTQITTSKHCMDMTAHGFLEENGSDLGLRVLRGFSADMEDLLTEHGQREALGFFRYVLWSMEQGISDPVPVIRGTYTPGNVSEAEERGCTLERDVLVLTDAGEEDGQLQAMIRRFGRVMPAPVRVLNIREMGMKGGCLGCLRCAPDGHCVYKDGFEQTLRREIQTADAMVYAFRLQDHSMGPMFKMFDDRQFCNGHRTVTQGMPVAYLVSGAYSGERNLPTLIEAKAEMGGNTLVGVVSDETDPDTGIDRLAMKLAYTLENRYTRPANFYGVGGMKIFRDLIWQMRGLMREDHRFFKSHGQYDFPQKRPGRTLLMYPLGFMLKNPFLRKKIAGRMDEGMLAPYQKVLEQTAENKRQ